MNRIILEESEFRGDSLYCLNARKSNHVIKILKSKIGNSLKAGLLNRSLGTAIVYSIDVKKREVFVLYVEEKEDIPFANLANVRIFSAIQRPQTVKKMIQLGANCGISELYFFPANKSESSYLNSSIWDEKNLLDEVLLGLEQGSRIKLPKIEVLKSKYKIKEHLTQRNRFILDFNSKSLLDSKLDFSSENPIQLVLGPESGLTEIDLEFFLGLSFERISVSENILRSEVAFAFVLSQIELLKSRTT